MSTQSTQIKVTLPIELYEFVQAKASRFGMSVASYAKHVLLNEVKDSDIPTFKMSKKREKLAEQAWAEYKAGKTIEINDIEEFFNSL